MKTRIFTLLMAMMMVLGLFAAGASVAFAEEIAEAAWGTDKDNLTEQGTLQEALDAAGNDGSITYIKVAQDIDLGDAGLVANGGNFTLDLNGKTVESSNSRLLGLKNSVDITIADSADGGKLYCKGYNAIAMYDSSNVRITVSGGTFESENSSVIDLADFGNLTEAELTITGGTLKSNGITSSVISASGKSVKISGGSFESNHENIYWKTGTLDFADYSTPDGLTFFFALDYDPELSIEHVFLPDNYSLYHNGVRVDDSLQDGTAYTVNPTKYQVTINEIENGSISLSPEGGSYAPGTELVITAIPDEGYMIDVFLVGGESVEGNTATVVVNADTDVSVTFKRIEAAWGTDKDNLTEQGTLADAFAAAIESENATYIQLSINLNDILLPQLTAGTITFDLNGKMLINCSVLVDGADLTVIDSAGDGCSYSAEEAICLTSGKVTLLNGALQGDYQELTFKGGVVDLGKYAFLEGFRVYNSTDSDIALSEGNFILPVGAHFRDIDGNKIDVLAAYQTYAIVLDEVAWGTDADHLTSSGSLEDAVKAANEAEGALYIRVNKQLHLYDDITFDGCEVTLDFAGNMILAIADVSIKNGAKVTFVDKTDEGGIVSVEYYGIYVKKATLVIEGGSYGMSEELGYTSYEPFEIQNGADVTINGGNVTAIYEAFRVYGGAKLTVNDGTFTAGYSIFITLEIGSSNKSSTIVVNGGEFVNAGSDDFAHIAYTAKSNFDLTAMGDEIEGWLVEIHEYDLFGINGEGFLPEGYTLYDQYGMPGSHILTADIYEYYAGLFTIGKAPEESYTVTFVDTVFGGEDIVLTVYPENNEFTIFYDEMFKKPDTLLYLYFDEYGYKYDMDFLVTEDTIIYLEYELELLEAPTKENNALIKTAYDDQIASYVWYIRINEEYVLVEDETANSLQNPVYGYSYYVEAVMKNGKKAYFVYDHIDFTFVLEETSPVETTQKPFVELEDETGAKYQWYEVEITYGDEFGSDSELIVNAYEEENRNNLSYEEGRGWIVLPDSDDWCSYVKIYLQAGQTIGLTYDRDVIATSIWLDEDVANDQYTQWDGLIAGQTVFFTAEQEGWYEMDVKLSYALDIPAVRIDDVTVVETLLEGETQSVMQNPTINKSYICKISDAKDWSVLLQSPVINYENGFVKQPDSASPSVEVADDTDAKYQWYTIDFGTEITDANAILLEGSPISFNYVEGLGWEGVAPQMAIKSTLANGAYYFAMFEAEEDESIRILFSVPVSGTLVIAGEDDEQIYVQLNNATYYEGKVAGAGMNGILLIVGNALSPTSTLALAPAAQVDNSTVYARIFIGESTKTPIEGETLATLQNPEFGTWYFCTVEDANGDVFESNVFQYTYVITKQPTMADPSIELNKTTGEESYQWYQITENGNEITPDSELFFAEEQASWYDSDNGWYGTLEYSGGVYADYIYIRLKEGQTITVVPSRNVEQIGIWQSENDVGDYIEYIYANEKAILTAPQDGIYVVYAGSFQIDNPIEEVTLRIYDNTNDGMVALEGETAATLSHNLPGTYVCVVTGVNGLSVTSEPLVIGAIVSIQKTSTDGLVDTYTITYTDGSTSIFTVTNGKDGEQGEKGEKGDQGEQGIQGEKGDKGDQGDQGIQGEKGEKGDQGEQGIQGEKGDKGDQGEQGIQGEKGDKGDQGEQGIQGDKGADGTNGKDGVTPVLRINSETNEWEVSYDGGATWTSFGVKATGANGTNGTNGANGTHGVDGKDGENGKDGKDGENGKDGLAVAATVIGSTSFATQIGLIGYELIRRKRPNWIDAVKNFKLKEVKFPWKKS